MIHLIRFSLVIAMTLSIVGCASIVKPTAVVHIDETTTILPVMEVAVEEVKPTVNEEVPQTEKVVVETPPAPLEELVVEVDEVATFMPSEKDIECLAHNIYYEARGEGVAGMTAVGYVTTNRAAHRGFPTTICGVVHEKRFVKGRAFCQFSWVCNQPRGRLQPASYQQAREIAIQVLKREIRNPIGNGLYFHEKSLRPRFAKAHNFVATIGNHKFYSAP